MAEQDSSVFVVTTLWHGFFFGDSQFDPRLGQQQLHFYHRYQVGSVGFSQCYIKCARPIFSWGKEGRNVILKG